jgi:hypothetical protein
MRFWKKWFKPQGNLALQNHREWALRGSLYSLESDFYSLNSDAGNFSPCKPSIFKTGCCTMAPLTVAWIPHDFLDRMAGVAPQNVLGSALAENQIIASSPPGG